MEAELGFNISGSRECVKRRISGSFIRHSQEVSAAEDSSSTLS